MLEENELRRRVLWRVFGHPVTIAPFLLGMTAMTATWTLGWNTGLGWFAGLAGVLGAAGLGVTRLVLAGERIAQDVSRQLTLQEQHEQARALDELDRRLTAHDDDPRPETALRDLRALLKAFEEAAQGNTELNVRSLFDIRSMVGQLFDQCVHSLHQTERLALTAQELKTAAARQPILEQRERIIAEVQGCIKQLSDTLVALQTMAAGPRSVAELNRLRADLDQSLAVAKKVEERLDDLVRETGVRSLEPTSPLNQKQKGEQL